ncbi:MAG: regulatory protein RecX [Dehalococcoidia bacterium]
MLVTAVVRKPRRAGRVDVYVDGEVAFDVQRDTARTSELRPGRSIEPAEIEAIIAADRKRQALEAAVALLARRPRSEREVRSRLAQRKFPAPIIEETMARLDALKLIDDAAFARYWAETRDRTSPRGRRLVTQELRSRGVDAGMASEATAELSDADAAYRVASRRARSLAAADYQTFRNRLGSLLQRRGFGWDVAGATVERCWQELGRAAAEDDLVSGIE